MGGLPGDIGVSIAIPVGIVLAERSTRFRRIETLALQVAEIQAEGGVAAAAVHAAARPGQRLQHFDQSLLAAFSDVFSRDDVDRLQRLGEDLRKSGSGDDYGIFRTLSKRERRRGRDERGDDGSFQGFLPRHASPQADIELREEMRQRGTPVSRRAPRHFPPSVEAGLRACGIGAYRLPAGLSPTVAEWIRPRALTVAGAAEAWAGETPCAAPLSRFTPARATRRDTSNERVDCTTQVAGFRFAAASGIYIENESLHLDLTGFSEL